MIYAILIATGIVLSPLLLAALGRFFPRRGLTDVPRRNYYDTQGNHAYYDRKLMRRRKAPDKQKETEGQGKNTRQAARNYYDAQGNHAYYDRKLIRHLQRGKGHASTEADAHPPALDD